MYQIYFYVPKKNLEELLEAMFKAGGGSYGHYDRCCWLTEGRGQYRALEGSQPHIGKRGETVLTQEIKVEMICIADKLAQVIDKLRKHHPYEEPAYGVIKLEQL